MHMIEHILLKNVAGHNLTYWVIFSYFWPPNISNSFNNICFIVIAINMITTKTKLWHFKKKEIPGKIWFVLANISNFLYPWILNFVFSIWGTSSNTSGAIVWCVSWIKSLWPLVVFFFINIKVTNMVNRSFFDELLVINKTIIYWTFY